MDVLRTSVSVLAHFDPEVNAPPSDHAANVRKAERMIAQMPTAVAFRERIATGRPVIPPATTSTTRPISFTWSTARSPPKPCVRRSTCRWSFIPSTS